MKKFTSVHGKALPLLLDDIDTDQIAPASLMRTLAPDYKTAMFGHQRANARSDGRPLPFDLPQYADAPILVTGKNFGCGSAREVAVWALAENGIRCIIAPSFSAVFRESCLKNSILPVTLDAKAHAAFAAITLRDEGHSEFGACLSDQQLVTADGTPFPFEFDAQEREALLNGLDDVSGTMRYDDEISSWERRSALTMPWLRQGLISESK